MTTIKQALQNLKNNGLGYYPCLVGGKLHINQDENLYMLVRNDTHEIVCQWNKHTGVVCVLGELAWYEKSRSLRYGGPGTRLTGRPLISRRTTYERTVR